MRARNIIAFLLVAAIIFMMCYVCLFDVTIGDYRFPSALDEEYGIKQGLDLVGGSLIEFQPEEGVTPSAGEIETVQTIMRNRLDSQSYYDATIAAQADNTIRVEIPNVDNPADAVALLGSTAQLTFRDYNGELLMEGTKEFVKNAEMTYGQTQQYGSAEYYVTLELTDAGREKFKEATTKALSYEADNQIIAIYMDYDGTKEDNRAISSPRVNEVIDSASCMITGNFDKDSATQLAAQIRSGQLPFKLNVTQQQSVGATLGEEALSKSLVAGGIGILLVILFMILIYRLSGAVAAISLCAYTALVVIILVNFGATLTLSGIAGLVLSIGMAVDADCIIFERLKEELRSGKTVGSSVDSAFNRALSAILDANITTLIAAVVLYFFGTGSIKGFAVTLGVGTVVSFFTAIFLTKWILKLLINGFHITCPCWFGVKKGANN